MLTLYNQYYLWWLFNFKFFKFDLVDVLVCCVHPGTVRTDVFRHMPLPVKILVSTVFRVLTKVWTLLHQNVLDIKSLLSSLTVLQNISWCSVGSFPLFFFSSRITITHACIRFVSILLLHLCITSLFPIFALFLCHNRIGNFLVSNKYCCKIQFDCIWNHTQEQKTRFFFFCFFFLTKVYNGIFCDKQLFQLVFKLSALSSHM